VDRKFCRIAGAVCGSADVSVTAPRDSGRVSTSRVANPSVNGARNGGIQGQGASGAAVNRICMSGVSVAKDDRRNAVTPPGTSLENPRPVSQVRARSGTILSYRILAWNGPGALR